MAKQALKKMQRKPLERILLNGVEYKVTEEAGGILLERRDPTGFTVVNVFKDRPDSGERMEEFKKQAAALVLQAVEAAEGEGT
ncbi:MAG: hypothetical protein AB1715_14530 [Acidobacteriota bacterium]